ncbi:hypothetical protein HAX54_001198 [Datura stramonium]|uniref:Uncharacterized protein n=1 Tax=Datura stramonium TaxID=4076 RepID=A0ABS8T2N7_DATST|nr:hypothetical protein [Datura stramonium]
MQLTIQQESTRNQNIMSSSSSRSRRRRMEVILCAWMSILVFSELCISSTGQSTPRKVGFFHPVTNSHHVAAAAAPTSSTYQFVGTGGKRNRENKLYDEDKRLVHTGPNPLHN